MIRSFGLRVRLVAVVAVLALAATLGTSVASAGYRRNALTPEGIGPSAKWPGSVEGVADREHLHRRRAHDFLLHGERAVLCEPVA